MRSIFLTVVFILIRVLSFAQSDSIYAELQFKGYSYKGAHLTLDVPKVLILEKYGLSDIISLGIVKGNEVGVQLELLKSSLGNKTLLVCGIGYFLKKDGEWKMSSFTNFSHPDCKVISDKSQMNTNDFIHSGSSVESRKDNTTLEIKFLQRYYIIK